MQENDVDKITKLIKESLSGDYCIVFPLIGKEMKHPLTAYIEHQKNSTSWLYIIK